MQILLLGSVLTHGQPLRPVTLHLQQGGMYYKSTHMISTGAGFGVGATMLFSKTLLAQADLGLYWMNGNAIQGRIAFGVRKPGKWAPSVMAGCSIVGGDRTEFIMADEKRIGKVKLVPEVRISPFRFQNALGNVSVAELGLGFGTDQGYLLNFTLLSVGINMSKKAI